MAKASLWVLVLAWAINGCAPGPKLAKYQEPSIDESKLAVLKGYGGTYITIVDNQSAPGSTFKIQQGWGGNTVRLAPGKHDITIHRELGSNPSGASVSLSINTGKKVRAFSYVFEAGHEYEVGPRNRLNPFDTAMVLKDKTEKTEHDLTSN